MQIHLLAAIVVLIAGFVLQINSTEWCLIVFAIVGVWVSEMFNTSIEVLTDLVSPDYHELAGKVKDIAAGGVVLATLGAVVIGGIVFFTQTHYLRITVFRSAANSLCHSIKVI